MVTSNKSDRKFDDKFKIGYLKPKYWLSWIGILFLGALAFTPICFRNFLATLISCSLSWLNIKFKRVVMTNFRLAFPEMTKAEKEKLYRDFLRVGLKIILSYGDAFFRSKDYMLSRYSIKGQEYYEEAIATNKPIIFLAPHFWAIDKVGPIIITLGTSLTTMMHTSKNEVYDYFMNKMRLIFGGKVYERGAGLKSIIRVLKGGEHTFFLPDEDLGRANSVFVDFFATKKSTLMTLSKLSKLSGAIVVPILSRYNESNDKYELVFSKLLDNYPSGDDVADAARMNKSIEELVVSSKEQYMWFLKYYKTRPEDEDEEVYS
jgi:lauroyl-KDO2-lipid IV(A) myristoyltransferase